MKLMDCGETIVFENYGERKPSERVKFIKDIEQSAALIDWHIENGCADKITEAWYDAISRGPGWKSRAQTGLNFMLLRHPEFKNQIEFDAD